MTVNDEIRFEDCVQQLDDVRSIIRSGLRQSNCSAISDLADGLSVKPADSLQGLACLASFYACVPADRLTELQPGAIKLAAVMQVLEMGLTLHTDAFANVSEQSHDQTSHDIVLGDYLWAYAYTVLGELENERLTQMLAEGIESICTAQLIESKGLASSRNQSLLKLGCSAAAALADSSEPVSEKIDNIAEHIAFAHSSIQQGDSAGALAQLQSATNILKADKQTLRTSPFYGLIIFMAGQLA